jgi:two pore calcium channel protein 2
MAVSGSAVLETSMNDLSGDGEEESIWLLGSRNASRYDYAIFSREDDEHSVKQAKVFIDDAIHYRSIMHSIDPLALKLYRIYFSKPIRWCYFVVIAILLSLAFFEFQTTLSYTSDSTAKDVVRYNVPCGVTEAIELVCFIIFVCDMILQWRLTGTKRFIRRPWSVVYVTTVLVSVVDLFVSFGFCLGGGYGSYPYRIRRLLRPLIFLQSSSVMKKMVNALKKTLPGILSVLFLLGIHLYLYAIIGMLIFQTSCKEEETHKVYNCSERRHRFRKHEECDLGNTTNATEGFQYFDELGEGLVNMIVLLTTANHPDIMMPAYKQNRLYSLYFISYLVIGLYILMNVLTAVVYNQFRGFLATSIQSSFTRRRVGQFAAFVILANRTKQVKKTQGNKLEVSKSYVRLLLQEIKLKKNILGLISERLELLTDDMLTWSQFRGIFVALRGTQRRKEKHEFQFSSYRWMAWLQYALLHKYCTYFSLFITVLNCIVISLMVVFRCDFAFPNDNTHPNYILGILNLLFLPYYVVECIVYIVFLRRYFFLQIRHWYDLISAVLIVCGDIALICVLQTFDASIYVGTAYKEARIVIQITHIFVMLRLLRIIPHVSALRHIANTILHLMRNLRAYVGLMICIYYFFAILGMIVFNGVHFSPHERNENGLRYSEICGTYEQSEYYPNNFDDFGSSLIVLYDVMVVNNWYVFLNAYGRVRPYSQIFFIIWWLIASVIGLSLLVALLLEAFITKWEAAKKSSMEGTDNAKSSEIEDLDFDNMLEEEDVVDLLKGELKEPGDEELIRELLKHDDIKFET